MRLQWWNYQQGTDQIGATWGPGLLPRAPSTLPQSLMQRAGSLSGLGQGRGTGRRREGAPGIPLAPPPLPMSDDIHGEGGRELRRGAGSTRPCDAERERAALQERSRSLLPSSL